MEREAGSRSPIGGVTSRILWGIGFHQPPTYYLNSWNLTGAETGGQPAGRFRPELRGHKVVGEWSWYENPFVGSQEYGGLIVANLILNSWDWKMSNNKIYAVEKPLNGVSQWYVVRDLGASLGKTTYPRLLNGSVCAASVRARATTSRGSSSRALFNVSRAIASSSITAGSIATSSQP